MRAEGERDWLDLFAFGAELSDSGRDTLDAAATEVSAAEGTILLEEGAASDPVLLVDRGSIRVFKRSGDGREITLYRIRPGEMCVVGVASALSGLPYAATAVVSAPLRAHAIPAPAFGRIFAADPALQQFVMRLIAERLAGVMTTVVEVGFQKLDQRLARFLVRASDQTGIVALTHEQIARELGTAREVVTRVLDSLEMTELVSLSRRRIEIRDPGRLRRMVEAQGD